MTISTALGASSIGRAKTHELADTFFEMDQRKNEFLATLAHELRNPLAPIKNGLQLLGFMHLNDDAECVRAMMARQVEQIVHLVDDLLDISRISCGKLVLDKQVCKVSAIAQVAIEESAILMSEKGMTLEVTDQSGAACVCGDQCRLTQIICNLLNNSARYGRVGGKVSLRLDVRDDVVVIRVTDNGIGIAADRLKDIFRMYSQIESAQGRGSVGLGIGLALVKTLVELHGGSVRVESAGLDCGSTFTVQLPLAVGSPMENAPATADSTHTSRSFCVLVVDDLRAIRHVTQMLLQKLGHEVRVAENGQAALKMLDTYTPDVVISDVTMPVMGGYDLARQIRQRKELASSCLVALTGHGQSSDQEMAFEAGFDRHLTKPINIHRLQELFDELDKAKQDKLEDSALKTRRLESANWATQNKSTVA